MARARSVMPWRHHGSLRAGFPIVSAMAAVLLALMPARPAGAEDVIFESFEGPLHGWTTTGDAFAGGPVGGTLPDQIEVSGYQGLRLVNSFLGKDAGQGTLTSPAFRITHRYIRFLIGGGFQPGRCEIRLVVGGTVRQRTTGPNCEELRWNQWDVGAWMGQDGVIQIVDQSADGMGYILIDQIVFSDGGRPPGHLTPRAANVWQVAPGAVQFGMSLAQAPPTARQSGGWITYRWYVDTDGNPNTGHRFGAVGAEHVLDVTLSGGPMPGGGIRRDQYLRRAGGRYPAFVGGGNVCTRVPLSDLGNPARFTWACGASSSDGPGGSQEVPNVFRWSRFSPRPGEPVRVVVAPSELPLRDGISAGTLAVRAYDRDHRLLDLSHRAVELFSASDALHMAGMKVTAVPGRAGLAQVAAMVDGVMSCNSAQVMVGSVDLVPAVLNLDRTTRTSAKVALRAVDVTGKPVPLDAHQVVLRCPYRDTLELTPDGTVRVREGGRQERLWVDGRFDGTPAGNSCAIRVADHPMPLQPEVEALSRYFSFWYSPVGAPTPGAPLRIEEMVTKYRFPGSLDALSDILHRATGALPWAGQRQSIATLLADDKYLIWGGGGNPILLGFNPSWTRPDSGVQLADGNPNWPVIAHEMGHSFAFFYDLDHLLTRFFYPGTCRAVRASIPAEYRIPQRLDLDGDYAQALAEFTKDYALHAVISRPDHCGLPADSVEALRWDLQIGRRAFVDDALATYLKKGARYLQDVEFPVLMGMLLLLDEENGWAMLPRFYTIFWPPGDTVDYPCDSEEQRATFVIAALSAAAKTDLRPRFRGWGFPCLDRDYQTLYPELLWRAGQRDREIAELAPPPPVGDAVVLEDFERPNPRPPWTATGDAFAQGSVFGTLSRQQRVTGYEGLWLANSFRGDDAAQGTLTSPPFRLTRRYARLLVGGGNQPGKCEARLSVGGETRCSATGENTEHLRQVEWDVSAWNGQEARLQIVDQSSDGWGHILVDDVILTNEPLAGRDG